MPAADNFLDASGVRAENSQTMSTTTKVLIGVGAGLAALLIILRFRK
jgi:hypothetical protein